MSKSARNLAENPTGCLLLVHPVTHDEFRLDRHLRADRAARAGLRTPAQATSTSSPPSPGMQDVFRLRAADVFRVIDIEQVPSNAAGRRVERGRALPGAGAPGARPARASRELCARISRCGDLDTLVRVTVDGLAELLGHEHSLLLLLDEDGPRLFTIASHGYETEGVGSEVPLGEGVIGIAAASGRRPCGSGNAPADDEVRAVVRRSFEESGEIGPGHEIPVPGLADGRQPHGRARPSRSARWSACWRWTRCDSEAYGPADEAALTRRRVARSPTRSRRSGPRSGSPRPPPARRRPAGRAAAADPDHPRALLPGRRQHVPRRGLPHQGRGRSDPVVPARPVRPGGPGRLHQPRGAARPDARPARLQGQLREPAHPAEAPARRAGRARSASRRPAGAASASTSTTPSASRRCPRASYCSTACSRKAVTSPPSPATVAPTSAIVSRR